MSLVSRATVLPPFLLWLAAAATGLGCGSPGGSSGRPVTRVEIGPAGGLVSAANGRIKVQIPAGALTSKVAITIQQIDPPAAGTIGQVFEVGPTGTTFLQPVVLSLRFAAADLGGAAPLDLRVATLSRGAWVPVASTLNSGTNMVGGQIKHLSPWTLIVYTAPIPPEPDAGSGGTGGTAGPDAGASEGGAAGAASGSGGAGGTGGTGGAGGAGGRAGAGGSAGGVAGGGSGGSGGAGGSVGAAGQGGGGAGGAGGQGGAGSGGKGGVSGTGGQGMDASADAADGAADSDAATNPDAPVD
jgi:hypothetical protein